MAHTKECYWIETQFLSNNLHYPLSKTKQITSPCHFYVSVKYNASSERTYRPYRLLKLVFKASCSSFFAFSRRRSRVHPDRSCLWVCRFLRWLRRRRRTRGASVQNNNKSEVTVLERSAIRTSPITLLRLKWRAQGNMWLGCWFHHIHSPRWHKKLRPNRS